MALAKPECGWRYEDLLQLPDDGKRYKIIEGELYEMPSPKWGHQKVIGNLYMLLVASTAGSGALVGVVPFDIMLQPGGDTVVQPDLFV